MFLRFSITSPISDETSKGIVVLSLTINKTRHLYDQERHRCFGIIEVEYIGVYVQKHIKENISQFALVCDRYIISRLPLLLRLSDGVGIGSEDNIPETVGKDSVPDWKMR